MLVKIKPWDEAVKAALADNEDWHVKNGNIFGISSECGAWGEVVEGYKEGKYFRSGNHFTYPLCVVDEIIKDNDKWVNPNYILRYGKVIIDDQFWGNDDYGKYHYIHIRLIEFDGCVWYHRMVDGEVVNCRSVGKADA